MVLFFVVTLAVSIAGMSALLGLKRWELNTGRVAFASLRPGASYGLEVLLAWLQYALPSLVRSLAQEAWGACRALSLRLLARGALLLEQALEKFLHRVREQTAPRAGEASAFLRQVADHKRELQRRRVRRFITEE